jgi:DNA gyrase subunit A
VCLTSGKDEIIFITRHGQALRYAEAEVRSMGRMAMGVTGIRMRPGDQVVGLEVIEPDSDLLVVTEKGYGKRTPLGDYNPKGRGTMGMATIDKKAIMVVGPVVKACIVKEKDEITLISSHGIVIRMAINDISIQGRATRGVRIMHLEEGDTVAALARISE